MENKLDILQHAVEKAVENKVKYFAVKVNVGLHDPEIIINTVDNMVNGKLDYYMSTYNTELELKYNHHIKIIAFAMGNSFEEIQKNFAL